MKKVIRNLVEEDIDKLLDSEEISNKNFFFLILHYLLGNKIVDLVEIEGLATELSNEYKSYLEDLDIKLGESNGGIIDVLKFSIPEFNRRTAHILSKIEKLKENGNS